MCIPMWARVRLVGIFMYVLWLSIFRFGDHLCVGEIISVTPIAVLENPYSHFFINSYLKNINRCSLNTDLIILSCSVIYIYFT